MMRFPSGDGAAQSDRAQRKILELRFAEEMSTREVAEVLGLQ